MRPSVYLIIRVSFLLFVAVSCTNHAERGDGKIIYINNQSDFDEYNKTEFSAGTTILFAAGAVFNGQFSASGMGTVDEPIRVTAYDNDTREIYWETVDNKPIINGNGLVNSSFYLYNGKNWEINNLEITNTNGTTDDQGDLRGIHVVAENSGVMENVLIRNCYIHNVNGEVEGKQRGGIHVHVLGDSIKTKFHNLVIENNVVKRVGGVGIGNQSSWPNIDHNDYYPWTGVVIRGNRVERTGRNGIIIRYSIDPLVEYNVLAFNGRSSHGHSVFNFNTVGCIMQYNEAYGNTGDIDDIDRGGFDADYNSRGTIIQYNYSHDNHWFCGIMRRYNRDVTIRYNISVNERVGAYMYGFPWEDDVRGIKIYNNTHYFGFSANIIASPGRERIPGQTAFYNNIFYFEETGFWGKEPDETCEFSNNLFYNVEPKGSNYIVGNPMFVDIKHPGNDIDMRDPERLAGFRLQGNSPAIDAGIFVNDNGGQDFWGNTLYNNMPDIGAHETQ